MVVFSWGIFQQQRDAAELQHVDQSAWCTAKCRAIFQRT